jgi:DNA-binding MarR family transcriptional regulator
MSEGQRDNIALQADRLESDLGAIRRALRRPLESEVAQGGLTVPQTAFMRIVVRVPGISLKDLSREVSLAHSTVSGIADRLEQRGLIERRVDEKDGRFIRIFPTAPVTEWVGERMHALRTRPLTEALLRASEQERAAIETALRRLRELLDQG